MRIVPVNSVTSGIALGKNIHSENGDILLKKGVILTDHLLERIIENNIFTIYVDDGFTDQTIEDIIRPEVRLKALKSIKETFKQIEGLTHTAQDEKGTLKQKLEAKHMEKYIGKLKGICEYIVEDISQSQQMMINLVDIKNLNSHQYEHALQVALLATVIGVEMRLDKHQLYNLFLGAVLHDIGKLFIPKDLLSRPSTLSQEENAMFKRHTLLGYDYLKENYHFEAPARIIALQHHECYDGTGYPRGTSKENLHLFSRIVAVCNTYDNLVSDTPDSPAINAHEALEFLMGNAGRCFDFKVIEVFTRKVNPYPVGTLVELSDGKAACVIKDTFNYPLRPTVQHIDFKQKKLLPEVVDLMAIKTITITGIIQNT